MASEAPSWADQWGTGGIGAMEEEDATAKKEKDTEKPKGKGGFKTVAKKFKLGVAKGLTWVKSKCQKKSSSK
ncbi:hypothetical protein like AT1G11740 [Hibiscus trionum]|uniref:Uncharacterized protein n=1 Tax=Hibiscus trionum TaxID=183268 RepID=A0A9W7I9P4_HIBTR|nr:hypothetical protein like AT1G11740 [Hibiscus trionum]